MSRHEANSGPAQGSATRAEMLRDAEHACGHVCSTGRCDAVRFRAPTMMLDNLAADLSALGYETKRAPGAVIITWPRGLSLYAQFVEHRDRTTRAQMRSGILPT